ncbi:MAG: response regulator [Rhizomicrobium sp.]|jgi:DNA-binding response OmpR family regulator
MSQACINVSGMTSLLADSDHFTRDITSQIMRGFGAKPCVLADTGEEATDYLRNDCFDLCILEAKLPDMFCAELIRWVRRLKDHTARFTPILVLSSYTQLRYVTEARDAGANLVARKPISPQILFDRITWIARADRPFIEAGQYIGPDRRFKDVVPPDGIYKRETDAGSNAENTKISGNKAPPVGALSEAT